MKKTKSLIFTIALLAMVLSASTAFADTASFLFATSEGYGVTKVSSDELVSLDITVSVDATTSADPASAIFLKKGDVVYAADKKNIYKDVKFDAGTLTFGTEKVYEASAESGDITAFAVSDDYYAVVTSTKLAVAASVDVAVGAAANKPIVFAKSADLSVITISDDKVWSVPTLGPVAKSLDAAFAGSFLANTPKSADFVFVADSSVVKAVNITTAESTDVAVKENTGDIFAISLVGDNLYVLGANGLYAIDGDGASNDAVAEFATPITEGTSFASADNTLAVLASDTLTLYAVSSDSKLYPTTGTISGVKAVVAMSVEGVDFSTTTTEDPSKPGDDTTSKITTGESETEDFTKLDEAVQQNIKDNTPFEEFLAPEDVTTSNDIKSEDVGEEAYKTLTSEDALIAKVSSDLGVQFASGKVITFGLIQPSVAGAVLQKVTIPSDTSFTLKKFVFYFIKVSVFQGSAETKEASLADNDKVEAILLDKEGNLLSDSESATLTGDFYAVPSEALEEGEQYAMVAGETAETGSTDEPEDKDTTVSKSSSGCDAGFGIWSLAALLAISKLSKRR